ncbi:hypothetical protein F5Y17DRAFT_343829 [Xylariaceae sp. FL0594]|nr:hypothetical protein F5Y17DRAFT_343829 [Xylariaceae sp. FL0594]
MTAPQAADRVADIQRRAAESPEVAFRAFDTYPWPADPIFHRNLSGALYDVEPQGPSLAEVALQLRVERFAERIKISIDKEAYQQWLADTGGKPPRLFSDQHLAQEIAAQIPPEERRLAILHGAYGYPPYQPPPEPVVDPSVPSWQREAPKAELFVPRNAAPASDGKDTLPYPKKFEEIVMFLQTGQKIPGIREIPDTVIDDPTVSTRGTMPAPLKPWERNSNSSGTNIEKVPESNTTA